MIMKYAIFFIYPTLALSNGFDVHQPRPLHTHEFPASDCVASIIDFEKINNMTGQTTPFPNPQNPYSPPGTTKTCGSLFSVPYFKRWK